MLMSSMYEIAYNMSYWQTQEIERWPPYSGAPVVNSASNHWLQPQQPQQHGQQQEQQQHWPQPQKAVCI